MVDNTPLLARTAPLWLLSGKPGAFLAVRAAGEPAGRPSSSSTSPNLQRTSLSITRRSLRTQSITTLQAAAEAAGGQKWAARTSRGSQEGGAGELRRHVAAGSLPCLTSRGNSTMRFSRPVLLLLLAAVFAHSARAWVTVDGGENITLHGHTNIGPFGTMDRYNLNIHGDVYVGNALLVRPNDVSSLSVEGSIETSELVFRSFLSTAAVSESSSLYLAASTDASAQSQSLALKTEWYDSIGLGELFAIQTDKNGNARLTLSGTSSVLEVRGQGSDATLHFNRQSDDGSTNTYDIVATEDYLQLQGSAGATILQAQDSRAPGAATAAASLDVTATGAVSLVLSSPASSESVHLGLTRGSSAFSVSVEQGITGSEILFSNASSPFLRVSSSKSTVQLLPAYSMEVGSIVDDGTGPRQFLGTRLKVGDMLLQRSDSYQDSDGAPLAVMEIAVSSPESLPLYLTNPTGAVKVQAPSFFVGAGAEGVDALQLSGSGVTQTSTSKPLLLSSSEVGGLVLADDSSDGGSCKLASSGSLLLTAAARGSDPGWSPYQLNKHRQSDIAHRCPSNWKWKFYKFAHWHPCAAKHFRDGNEPSLATTLASKSLYLRSDLAVEIGLSKSLSLPGQYSGRGRPRLIARDVELDGCSTPTDTAFGFDVGKYSTGEAKELFLTSANYINIDSRSRMKLGGIFFDGYGQQASDPPASGLLELLGGSSAVTGATAGSVTIQSGGSGAAGWTGNSGSVSLTTAAGGVAGSSGGVVLASGPATSGSSGSIGISTGTSTDAASGSITVRTANAVLGSGSGSITVSVGQSSAGAGAPISLQAGGTTSAIGGALLFSAGGEGSGLLESSLADPTKRTGIGDGGSVTISGGRSKGTTGGAVTISSGDSAAQAGSLGGSGSIVMQTAPAAASTGSVAIASGDAAGGTIHLLAAVYI
eukprot:jgi/Chlat1/1880/Chrsp145S02209